MKRRSRKPRSDLRKELLADETGSAFREGGRVRACVVFPGTYSVGMSNLGFQSILGALGNAPGITCERAFTDGELGPVSLETARPLSEFDLIAFSIPFELGFVNAVRFLMKAGIPCLRSERKGRPYIIAGGPAITANALPIAPYLDLAVRGEGKRLAVDVAESLLEGKSPTEELAGRDGVFDCSKPESWPVPAAPFEGWAESVIVTPNTEFSDTLLLEINRGCPRRCRFCLVSHIYPWENRLVSEIIETIEKHGDSFRKVGLVGSAISDIPEIDGLCETLSAKQIPFSVSSVRAAPLSCELVKGLVASGQKSLTLAPETASVRLGKSIGKWIPREKLVESVRFAIEEGIDDVKLYFLFGLPGEKDEDVEAIGELSLAVRDLVLELTKPRGHAGEVTVTMAPFVPKPFTPFASEKMCEDKVLRKRLKLLRSKLDRVAGIRLAPVSLREARLQATLATGGVDTAQIVWEQAGKRL